MGTIPTKFNKHDRAYYVIYATASIYPVIITAIKLDPSTSAILYDIIRADIDVALTNIAESDLYTFAEAKNKLLVYLQDKLEIISALVAP